jgi:hypothetical protein
MSAHGSGAAGSGGSGDLRASSPAPLPPLPPLALAAALGSSSPADLARPRSPLAEGAERPASPLLLSSSSAASEQQRQQRAQQEQQQQQQERRRRLVEQRRALQGPTPWSNWVIPGRLIAGGFPASPDDSDTRHTLLRLMGSPSTGGCGVTAFCCLQSELDPKTPAAAWRRGAALRPYQRDAAALLAEAADDRSGGKWLELPTLGPAAVVSCYGDGPPMMMMSSGGSSGGGGIGSGSGNGLQPQPRLDPFTATADMMGPGGSAAAAAAAANGRPPVPSDSPSASPRPGDPRCRILLKPDRRVDFLHLPIPDGGTAPDAALSALADDVAARVRAGQVVYAHCWGGHGRTGSLVSVVLARLYGLPAEAALRATQACHDARVFPQGTRSPQTQAQRQQVVRVVMAGGGAAAASPLAAAPTLLLRPQPPSPERERVGAGGGGGGGVGGAGGAGRGQELQRASAAMPPPPSPVRGRAGGGAGGSDGGGALASAAAAAAEPDKSAAVAALLRKRSRSPTNKIRADPAV